MKLVLTNRSDTQFSYLSGGVVLASQGQLEVPSRYWFSLLMDQSFMYDMSVNNFEVSDGLNTLYYPESKDHLIDLVTVISNKDSDGSPLNRAKITTSGWHYQLHGIEFITSTLDSVYSKKADGTDYNFTNIKFYELIDNIETQITGDNLNQTYLDSNCIKTVIDWEPTHDLEIIGGMLKMNTSPAENLRMWTVGVPDIPEVYGGSKPFAANVNLKYIGTEEGVKVDGRAPKYLTYSATYHTTKLRLIFRHSAGFKHSLHMIFELFKA